MKRLLLVLSICLLPALGRAATLSDVRSQVRVLIKDVSASRQRYSDAQLNTMINEAHRLIANSTWVIKKSTTIALVSGTTYYSLPTDTYHILRLTREYLPLAEESLEGLDSKRGSGWEKTGGTPSTYFQAPSRPNEIGMYPWPNSSSSTGTLRMDYVAQANTLSSDSDEPFNSDDRFANCYDTLVHWVAYQVFMLEGEDSKAQSELAYYQAIVALMNSQIGAKPNFLPSFGGEHK
jgi:hypothetical protein